MHSFISVAPEGYLFAHFSFFFFWQFKFHFHTRKQETEAIHDDAEQELVNAAKAIEALASKIAPVTSESGKIMGKQESEVYFLSPLITENTYFLLQKKKKSTEFIRLGKTDIPFYSLRQTRWPKISSFLQSLLQVHAVV